MQSAPRRFAPLPLPPVGVCRAALHPPPPGQPRTLHAMPCTEASIPAAMLPGDTHRGRSRRMRSEGPTGRDGQRQGRGPNASHAQTWGKSGAKKSDAQGVDI